MMSTVKTLTELDKELADIRAKSGQLTRDLSKLDAELADLERRVREIERRLARQGVGK